MSKRQHRMLYVFALLVGGAITIGLVLYALRQNINLFYTPTELAAQTVPIGAKIRLGGVVKEHSLVNLGQTQLEFIVTDYVTERIVRYAGVLPDLFREGQGVVALGVLDPQGTFIAQQILAKHDEKYEPYIYEQ